jgi:hypothetical protein
MKSHEGAIKRFDIDKLAEIPWRPERDALRSEIIGSPFDAVRKLYTPL